MKLLFVLISLLAASGFAQNRTDQFAQGIRGFPYGMPQSLYTNLVLFLPMWENPSNMPTWTVWDRSQAGNHGTQSTASYRPVWTNAAAGALVFDGVDDRVIVADNDNLSFGNGSSDSPFSLCCWLFTDFSKQAFPFSKWENSGAREWNFTISSNASYGRFFGLSLRDDSASATQQKYGTNITHNGTSWIFLSATYSGLGGASALNGVNLYINAQNPQFISSEPSAAYSAMENLSAPLSLSYQQTTYSKINLGDMMIFRKELTSNEVAQIYNLTKGRYGL
jgi:hypothetical protein